MASQPLVLVADDEPRITKLVAIALSEEGFKVITAANGEIHSVDEFYPKLLERIRPEGHQDAMTAVNYAWATEQRHRDKLGQVRKWSPSFFDQVAKSIDAKTGQYFVCQLCGCTLNKLPADACPVCKNPPKHYRHTEPPA